MSAKLRKVIEENNGMFSDTSETIRLADVASGIMGHFDCQFIFDCIEAKEVLDIDPYTVGNDTMGIESVKNQRGEGEQLQ